MNIKFSQVVTVVVEDDSFKKDIPARCIPDFDGGYVIEVKQTIYDGAVKGIGGYRAHILHEMCHAILCIMGFKPILKRSFKNYEITPYRSMEWQAKALCGEILMPYETTEGLSVNQIRFNCNVSTTSAKLRYNNYKSGGDFIDFNKIE